MDTLDYKPMRCATFKRGVYLFSLWYENPAEERRMKIHAIFCPQCRKELETAEAADKTFAPMLQDIRHEEIEMQDLIVNLGKDFPDLHSKQLMLEPTLFRDEDVEEPNSHPMVTGPIRAPVNPRHAHFEQALGIDGDN